MDEEIKFIAPVLSLWVSWIVFLATAISYILLCVGLVGALLFSTSIYGTIVSFDIADNPEQDTKCSESHTFRAEIVEIEELYKKYKVNISVIDIYRYTSIHILTLAELEQHGLIDAYANDTTILMYSGCDPNCGRYCDEYYFEQQYTEYNQAGFIALGIFLILACAAIFLFVGSIIPLAIIIVIIFTFLYLSIIVPGGIFAILLAQCYICIFVIHVICNVIEDVES